MLVAIAIPVFTTQLEKSRESTDLANLRAAYAAGTTAVLTGQVGPNDLTDGDYYYDPSADGSLASSGGATIGQGTGKDGKLDLSAKPTIITYANNTDAKGKVIKVSIASGEVTAIAFQ